MTTDRVGAASDARPILRRGAAGCVAASAILWVALAGHSAPAEPLAPTGGAGNTGVRAPAVVGGVRSGTVGRSERIDTRAAGAPRGNGAGRGTARVPGGIPGANVGGTATSGPPGTGGAAGGPALGNR